MVVVATLERTRFQNYADRQPPAIRDPRQTDRALALRRACEEVWRRREIAEAHHPAAWFVFKDGGVERLGKL